MSNDQYFTITELAHTLKVAYITVYRWIQSGKLKAGKAGRQYRINQTQLDKFLKQK